MKTAGQIRAHEYYKMKVARIGREEFNRQALLRYHAKMEKKRNEEWAKIVEQGIESWQFIMRKYLSKKHRGRCYDQLIKEFRTRQHLKVA